jgi:hypothetical protein
VLPLNGKPQARPDLLESRPVDLPELTGDMVLLADDGIASAAVDEGDAFSAVSVVGLNAIQIVIEGLDGHMGAATESAAQERAVLLAP